MISKTRVLRSQSEHSFCRLLHTPTGDAGIPYTGYRSLVAFGDNTADASSDAAFNYIRH